MLVGKLADATGVSRDTIRFYEKEGLIEPAARRDNNYKDYAEDAVQHLRFIKQLQTRGFTLSEIRRLLEESGPGTLTCGEVGDRFRAKVVHIDEQIAKLQAAKEALMQSFGGCKESTPESVCQPFLAKKLG